MAAEDNEAELRWVDSMIVIEFVILTLCALFAIVYTVVATFVFRKIGISNLVMSLMILSIGMVIALLIAFFSVNAVMFQGYRRYLETDGAVEGWQPEPIVAQIVQVSPTTFLQIAIVLNINLWMRYCFKIEGVAARLQLKETGEGERDRIRKQQRKIDICTLIAVLMILGYTVGIVIDYKRYYPTEEELTFEEIVKYQWSIDVTVGLFFAFVGIVFFAVSQMTINQIRKYFPQMYEAHKRKMRLAIFGLSVPLIFHAILDFLNLSPSYLAYKYEHVTF